MRRRSLSRVQPAAHQLIANPTRILTARPHRTSSGLDLAGIMFGAE